MARAPDPTAATLEIYPAGPASVPPDLTRPSPAYRRHAYLAVVGLLAFLALYFALAGWFAWTAVRLLGNLERTRSPLFAAVGGAGAALLALFMLKAVVFVRRSRRDGDLEISPAEHPRLFAFLHRVADEAKAPRPHRVFLSPQVNAAVFHDLSITNLVLPSKKNLAIGLGLVNVLTLGELKAVIAHEFGHFAQRAMTVGRWTYVAQQIAGQIVVRRDALDRFLQRVSHFDPRVAWIGWILRLCLWSIRSLVDTVFGWVVLAQRALAREMELQADLVAVSLSGSDALVHALHRLEAADDAFDRARAFLAAELRAGRAVADAFTVQTRMLERKRAILGDPSHGEVPPLPAAPASHRLFKAKLAHPPRMWATHPPSELREENAKRRYIAAPLDDRSGWLLFDDPAAVRTRVTELLYSAKGRPEKPLEAPPIEETLAVLDEKFDRRYFDPAYRGVYLGREVTRSAAKVDELCAPLPAAAAVPHALDELYPASLAADLARIHELEQERAMLEALQRGILEVPGGIVRFRGKELRRRALPEVIAQTRAELDAARKTLADHDRRVRAVHRAAARLLHPGWEEALRGLLALLHYAEHTAADLDDAQGSLANVFAIITADQKVTRDELERLVSEAHALHAVLATIYRQADQVQLGPVLAGKLGCESWAGCLGPFQLPLPNIEQMSEWLGVVGSWIGGTLGPLKQLSMIALNELLRVEEAVARDVRAGEAAAAPPPVPRAPARYCVFLVDEERPRQTKLGWWDRFQVADGFFPGALRFIVAGGLVALVLLAGRPSS